MLRGVLHRHSLIPSQVDGHHRVVSVLLAELHHLRRPAWKKQHQGSGESTAKSHTFSSFLNKSQSCNTKARAIFFGLS